MKDTAGMPAEELREEIIRRKLQAFDQFMYLSRATPAELTASGFKHPSDILTFAAKMNEARLKDWERNNPD